ncbi:hypothetical protein [Rhodoferax sp. GW822-FHT02A01]|uniref:hypothetical protein n=1 Tax=Rhodoferax sp. GW822-FHT02A01 TaxID=3141537 RepID=UPI00315D0922
MKERMKLSRRLFFIFVFVSSLGILLMTASCASRTGWDSRPTYSFGFDLRYDKQHAEILDYWYGKSRTNWRLHAEEDLVKEGKTLLFEGVTGPMEAGGLLYVKWRDTETKTVYEDTVDLRNRLPKNMEDHEIYLMIKGSQLYVYLVSPERRPTNMPSNGPHIYRSQIVTTIYPDHVED